MKIGFIGTGHIAAPMVRFLATRGHQICVSDRNAEVAKALSISHGVNVASNQTVVDKSDVVFLCLRPPLAQEILTPLTFRADQQVVSVMAGLGSDILREICAPVESFVQTIPLGYLEQGGCPLAAYGNDRLLAELFEPENPVIKVATESGLNAHFAICAFVPGVLDLMATASQWLGDQTGDEAASEFFVSQLLGGFLHAMPKDRPGTLPTERDALATEGTLSLQMTSGLRTGNAHEVLQRTLSEIGERLNP